MTYLELYEDALRKLHNSLITLGEFELMVKPLNREVETEPKTWEWIEYSDNYGHSSYFCSRCGTQEYKPSGFCPNCGADMRKEESEEDYDYERAVDQMEHDILYEPTYNPDDGSM